MGRRDAAGTAGSRAIEAEGPEAYTKTSQEIARHAFEGWKADFSRQGPRDLLHRTDQLLWELEMLNLAGCGQRRLPSGLRGDVVRLEERLSVQARKRLGRCRTVQDHIEAIFEVQEHLLRACVAQSVGDVGRASLLGGRTLARTKWLDGYLNDHLAGATLALDLGQESQRRNEGTPLGQYLVTLVHEIREDRETLRAVMEHLGIQTSGPKQAAGWLAEKAARAKFQAPVGGPDVANRLLEVEALLMGIRGKQAMWELLGRMAHTEPRLARFDFAQLTARAGHQLGTLNARRLEILDRELARACPNPANG